MSGLLWRAALALTIVSGPAMGRPPVAPPPMPPGFDDAGAPPQDVLAKIVNKLRVTLNDPYSIRDMTLCSPVKGDAYYNDGLRAWVKASWKVHVTLNSKNAFGGYTGSTLYSVKFENGQASEVTQFKGFDLLPPEANAKILEEEQRCPRVPDGDVQRLLSD